MVTTSAAGASAPSPLRVLGIAGSLRAGSYACRFLSLIHPFYQDFRQLGVCTDLE